MCNSISDLYLVPVRLVQLMFFYLPYLIRTSLGALLRWFCLIVEI